MAPTSRRPDSPRFRSAALLALITAFGCGAPAEERETTPPSARDTPAVTGPAGAPFAMHEWGVVDFSGASPQVRTRPEPRPSAPGAGVPRIRREAVTVDKPVLYVHLLDGAESARFDVRLDVNGGGVAELYPLMLPGSLGMPGGDGEPQDETEVVDSLDGDGIVDDRVEPDIPALREIFWQGVEASPGECVVSQPYPTMESDLCYRPLADDGVCEVASLRDYETRDGACLRYGGETYEHLFYRLRMGRLAPPLHVAPVAAGVQRVTNQSTVDVPGPVFVVRPEGILVVRGGVAAGETANATLLGERSAFFRAMGQALLAMGLTEDETVAFERAWNREFARVASGEVSLVYRLPEASVERIAPLRIAPAPRELTRVWIAMDRHPEPAAE